MSFFKNLGKMISNAFSKIAKKIATIKATGFNFGNTTDLARLQDKLIEQYKSGNKKISENQMNELKNHTWVKLAKKYAPNNLVIRQYCLIDLFSNNDGKRSKIYDLVKRVSYNNRIWAEGYTYWLYTLDALELWADIFNEKKMNNIICKINLNFLNTAYLRNDKWYPAPFGDLRDKPLDNVIQINHKINTIKIANIKLRKKDNKIVYKITGKPIDLNTHIPKDNSTISISNEIPNKFKFYKGYDKKYSSKVAEMADTFDTKRVKSI